jgi:Cytochrome c554 and c-prime
MTRFGKSLCAAAICVFMVSVPLARPAGLEGVPMATNDRVQLPGWWPTKGTASRNEFVGRDACAQCHVEKARTQARTPMANASTRAADSEALHSHEQLTFSLAPYTYQIVRTEDGRIYSVTDGRKTISAPLGWAFGLGEAGQTYIFERAGTFYESRVSYYRAVDGLDFTPGAPRTPSSTLEDALGRRMLYAAETRHCFGCHSTASTTSGRFDPTHMIPGVSCEACHGPGAKHVAFMRAGQSQPGLAAILNPARLNPVDVPDFCGACHRTFMDVGLTQSLGIHNLRFQPYRLERSRCWKNDPLITCLTCHDPHRPRVRDLAAYDDKCLGCHGSSATSSSAHKPSKSCSTVCVSCHMPKYEMPGMHFKFTDHFIRIVHQGDSYID